MLSIDLPESRNYMVLESLIDCLSKAVHVIDFSVKSEFDVGRRITNDITVSDISVSREQATIKLSKNNHVFLSDSKSKFGTFVLIKGLLSLDAKEMLPV